MKKKELEIAITTYTVAYKKGYTQCQEDMTDKKYTEEDVRHIIYKAFMLGVDRGIYTKELEDEFINSLNKQD